MQEAVMIGTFMFSKKARTNQDAKQTNQNQSNYTTKANHYKETEGHNDIKRFRQKIGRRQYERKAKRHKDIVTKKTEKQKERQRETMVFNTVNATKLYNFERQRK